MLEGVLVNVAAERFSPDIFDDTIDRSFLKRIIVQVIFLDTISQLIYVWQYHIMFDIVEHLLYNKSVRQ